MTTPANVTNPARAGDRAGLTRRRAARELGQLHAVPADRGGAEGAQPRQDQPAATRA